MLARLVGGPKNGELLETRDEIGTIVIPEFKSLSEGATYSGPDDEILPFWKRNWMEEVRYHRTRWTRDGARLYVVEGYNRSLIGDEEIEAAAGWLATEVAEAEFASERYRATSKTGIQAFFRDLFLRELILHREGANPDHYLCLSRAVYQFRIFTVKVYPGGAIGHRYCDGQWEPFWRWLEVPMPTIDGSQYEWGTAGSLVMNCPRCHRHHFRDGFKVLQLGKKEYCVYCGTIELVPLRRQTDGNERG